MNAIPIILSADNNYSGQMYVTIFSILESSHNSNYDFYLTVPENFSETNRLKIKKLEKKGKSKINFVEIRDDFKDTKNTIKRISTPTYYRLLAERFIPQEYSKCIYIDVDTIVCKDLKCLYEIDLGDNIIGGVREAPIAKTKEIRAKELNLPDCENYINAGVLLINLKKIREEHLTQKFITTSKLELRNQDQDVINLVCYKKIKPLHCKFNASPRNLFDKRAELVYSKAEIEEAKLDPVIIHYADKCKPWNSSVPFSELWWACAKQAPYRFDGWSEKKLSILGMPLGIKEYSGDRVRIKLFGLPIFYKRIAKNENRYRFLCLKWSTQKNIQRENMSQGVTEDKIQKILAEIQAKLNKIDEKVCSIEDTIYNQIEPDVSVIMPVYNTETYLSKALQTILDQSYRNFELICVNDGSTDRSAEILEKYKSRFKNLKVIETEKVGAGEARNIGMSIARGEYLLFLDSDDIFDKNLIKETFNSAKNNNADLVLFKANSYTREKNLTERADWALQYKYIPNKKVFSAQDLPNVLFQMCSSSPWNKLIKKSLVCDEKFQNIRNANDLRFIYSILAQAKRITALDKRLVTYRKRADSLQRTKSNHYHCIFEAWSSLKENLERKNLYKTFEKSFKNKALESLLYYYNTISDESKNSMQIELKERWIEYFPLLTEDSDYYYKKSDYIEMKNLVNNK